MTRRPSEELRRYTSAELASARRLKERHKLPVSIIAVRFGRSARALRDALRHPPAVPIDVRRRITEELIEEFVAGKTITEIARARGREFRWAERRMARAGFDGEMRALARAEIVLNEDGE
jgi:hypothetical protein